MKICLKNHQILMQKVELENISELVSSAKQFSSMNDSLIDFISGNVTDFLMLMMKILRML